MGYLRPSLKVNITAKPMDCTFWNPSGCKIWPLLKFLLNLPDPYILPYGTVQVFSKPYGGRLEQPSTTLVIIHRIRRTVPPSEEGQWCFIAGVTAIDRDGHWLGWRVERPSGSNGPGWRSQPPPATCSSTTSRSSPARRPRSTYRYE